MINRVKRGFNYKKIIPYFCITALTLLVLFTLLSHREFWSGYDTYFHMNAVYEDAMQIRTGHFSYFLSMFGFERSGRLVNGLYGPVFSYLCGVLLLMCHSWVNFEFTLFFITLVISGIETYRCVRLLRINRVVATISALFYIVSFPDLVMWVSDFEYTGLGAAVLLPLVVMQGIKILQCRQIKVLPLAVVMAVCLQIHLITSFVAVLILVPFVLCSWVLTRQKLMMMKNGLLVVTLSIVLSGNVIGSIYDVFSTNHLVPTFPNLNLQSISGGKALSAHNVADVLGLVSVILFLFVLILSAVKLKHLTVLDSCLLLEDLLFLWMASAYFPWNRLVRVFPSLASIVQYPIRFVTVPYLVTLLLVGRFISKIPKRTGRKMMTGMLSLLLLLALGSAFDVVSQKSQLWRSGRTVQYWDCNSQGKRIKAALRSRNLSRGLNAVHKITTDYLPTSSQLNVKNYYRWPLKREYARAFGNQSGFHKYVKDHKLLMNWQGKDSRMIQIPLIKYQNTVARLNGRIIKPKASMIGAMRVRQRKGYNHVAMYYQSGLTFNVMMIMCVVGWILVLLYSIYKKVLL